MNLTSENSVFNCSGFSNQHKEPMYCGLFEDRPSKVLIVCAAFLLTAFDIVMYYSIIWYERFGTDNHRNLVNRLLTSACWTVIVILIVCSADIVRSVFGPFPKEICIFIGFGKNSLRSMLLLYLDAIILSSYVVTVWLKNPERLKDDFWSLYVTLWIFFANTIFYLTAYILPGEWSHSFYTCAGTDPGPDNDLPFKMISFFEIPSIILHIAVTIRITIHKKNSQTNQHINIRSIFQKRFYLNILEKQTITDYFTNFVSVGGLFLLWIFGRKLRLTPLAELNVYPNYLYVYFHNLLAPALLGLFGIIICYKRHPPMKETIVTEVWRCISSMWTCIKNITKTFC